MEEASNTERVPYLFTSKELDRETGLYYHGQRYYDPRTSVWQSPDPILASYLDGRPNGGVLNPKNLNLLAYTGQNPVKYIDPNGLSFEKHFEKDVQKINKQILTELNEAYEEYKDTLQNLKYSTRATKEHYENAEKEYNNKVKALQEKRLKLIGDSIMGYTRNNPSLGAAFALLGLANAQWENSRDLFEPLKSSDSLLEASAFIVLGLLSRIKISEAKELVKLWGKGRNISRKANILDHYKRFGQLKNMSLEQFMRKVKNFKKKGARHKT